MLHNGNSHLAQMTTEQSQAADYIAKLSNDLRSMAKRHELMFIAACLEMARDAAYDISTTRTALKTEFQARFDAEKAEQR